MVKFQVFDDCYCHRIQFDGTAYLNSNHVLAMSSREKIKFDRNPVMLILTITCLQTY